MADPCRLCEALAASRAGNPGAVWDTILYETDRFAVIPSLGGLIEGWLLVVPKDHCICTGAIEPTDHAELEAVKSHAMAAVRDCFGSATCFEHGPSSPTEPVGCGVDHAHLHVVPARCDLEAGARAIVASELRWRPARAVSETRDYFLAGTSYFYLEQAPNSARIALADGGGPSQLFRKVIARHLGIEDRFDWRNHPMSETVRRTINRIGVWMHENRADALECRC